MEIKRRDRGYEVVDIQQRLAALDYDLGTTGVDGFFGPDTEAAVKLFQKNRKLAESGVVDEETWRQVVYATYRFGSRALYIRTPFFRGDDVRKLQLWLNSIGFRTDQIDGIFGPSTERAVREFQENTGVTPDGIVGPSTLAALHNIRSMLDLNQESVFSDPEVPDSVVSLLHDREIAIGCPAPQKLDWLAKEGNQQMICADLAHRFSNLLEILGARIHFFTIGQKDEVRGEIAIVFEPGGKGIKQDTLGLKFDHQSGDNRKLVDFITSALEGSLKGEIREIVLSDGQSLRKIGATLLFSNFAILSHGANLKKDVFKQKIAGAVLDGVKNFIETTKPF